MLQELEQTLRNNKLIWQNLNFNNSTICQSSFRGLNDHYHAPALINASFNETLLYGVVITHITFSKCPDFETTISAEAREFSNTFFNHKTKDKQINYLKSIGAKVNDSFASQYKDLWGSEQKQKDFLDRTWENIKTKIIEKALEKGIPAALTFAAGML